MWRSNTEHAQLTAGSAKERGMESMGLVLLSSGLSSQRIREELRETKEEGNPEGG